MLIPFGNQHQTRTLILEQQFRTGKEKKPLPQHAQPDVATVMQLFCKRRTYDVKHEVTWHDEKHFPLAFCEFTVNLYQQRHVSVCKLNFMDNSLAHLKLFVNFPRRKSLFSISSNFHSHNSLSGHVSAAFMTSLVSFPRQTQQIVHV